MLAAVERFALPLAWCLNLAGARRIAGTPRPLSITWRHTTSRRHPLSQGAVPCRRFPIAHVIPREGQQGLLPQVLFCIARSMAG
jgi:hypothetical protein